LAKSSTMKVVPLASRKAGEIKRTIVKTLSLDQLNESLRIVHPFSSGNDVEGFPSTNSTQGAGTPAASGGGAPATGPNALEGDADYLILVGDKLKVEQASLLVQQLDAALANMAGVGGSSGSNGFAPVTVPYQVHGGKAEDLAKAVASIAGGVSVV